MFVWLQCRICIDCHELARRTQINECNCIVSKEKSTHNGRSFKESWSRNCSGIFELPTSQPIVSRYHELPLIWQLQSVDFGLYCCRLPSSRTANTRHPVAVDDDTGAGNIRGNDLSMMIRGNHGDCAVKGKPNPIQTPSPTEVQRHLLQPSFPTISSYTLW